ncbi:MAG TPA: hypothetical protein VIJ00_09285, partial [Nakamurella sp.]
TNAPAGPRKAEYWTSCARRPGGIHADTYQELNPAAIQREIQELTGRPLTITTGKKGPAHEPSTTAPLRAHLDMSTGHGQGAPRLPLPQARVMMGNRRHIRTVTCSNLVGESPDVLGTEMNPSADAPPLNATP